MQNEVRASNPSYVTIPFVYFQMLAQAYYGRETPEGMEPVAADPRNPDPNPTPASMFNLKGFELFDEMPPGWKSLRKRNEDGK
jgi:hypothetical protein